MSSEFNSVPVKPEDDVFPATWPGMNDFVRAFTLGGDLISSTGGVHKEGKYAGKEFVILTNAEQQAMFQVTRLDAVSYVVKRAT